MLLNKLEAQKVLPSDNPERVATHTEIDKLFKFMTTPRRMSPENLAHAFCPIKKMEVAMIKTGDTLNKEDLITYAQLSEKIIHLPDFKKPENQKERNSIKNCVRRLIFDEHGNAKGAIGKKTQMAFPAKAVMGHNELVLMQTMISKHYIDFDNLPSHFKAYIGVDSYDTLWPQLQTQNGSFLNTPGLNPLKEILEKFIIVDHEKSIDNRRNSGRRLYDPHYYAMLVQWYRNILKKNPLLLQHAPQKTIESFVQHDRRFSGTDNLSRNPEVYSSPSLALNDMLYRIAQDPQWSSKSACWKQIATLIMNKDHRKRDFRMNEHKLLYIPAAQLQRHRSQLFDTSLRDSIGGDSSIPIPEVREIIRDYLLSGSTTLKEGQPLLPYTIIHDMKLEDKEFESKELKPEEKLTKKEAAEIERKKEEAIKLKNKALNENPVPPYPLLEEEPELKKPLPLEHVKS